MAETLNGELWYWRDVICDLETQGGIGGVNIDKMSASRHFFAGRTKKNTWFHVLWEKNVSVVISVSHEEPALINAFGKVFEYLPFCRYISENGLLTFEWSKDAADAEKRFAELQEMGAMELQRV
jgi:hypothetical protein